MLWGSAAAAACCRSVIVCDAHNNKNKNLSSRHFTDLLIISLWFSPVCRTLGLVFQSENFNYNHYSNYNMDSWSYLETPVPPANHSKPRLHPGDDLAALTMLYEQCRVKTQMTNKPIQNPVSRRTGIMFVFFCFYFCRTKRSKKCLPAVESTVTRSQTGEFIRFDHSLLSSPRFNQSSRVNKTF